MPPRANKNHGFAKLTARAVTKAAGSSTGRTERQSVSASPEQLLAQLSDLDKQLLQIFAVVYEPMSRTALVNFLKAIGYTHNGYRTLTTATFKTNLDGLIAQNFLIDKLGLGLQCQPVIAEIVTRQLVQTDPEKYARLVKQIHTQLPVPSWGRGNSLQFRSLEQAIRELRIGLYRQDWVYVEKIWHDYEQNARGVVLPLEQILNTVIGISFDPIWFAQLATPIHDALLGAIFPYSFWTVQQVNPLWEYLQGHVELLCATAQAKTIYLEQLLYRGEVDIVRQWLANKDNLEELNPSELALLAPIKGLLALLEGNTEAAIQEFELGLASLGNGKRKVYYDSLMGVWTILALLKSGQTANLEKAADYAKRGSGLKNLYQSLYSVLSALIKLQQGELVQKSVLLERSSFLVQTGFGLLVRAWAACWTDPEVSGKLVPLNRFPELQHYAAAAGYQWLATETLTLALFWQPNKAEQAKVEAFWQAKQLVSLLDVIPRREAWELCLSALTHLGQPVVAGQPAKPGPSADKRICWFLSGRDRYGWSLSPREQSFSSKGEWSRGRPIALKRLHKKPEEFPYLTPQDREICAHMEVDYDYSYYGSTTDYSFGEGAYLALIGHPLVFWEDSPTTRVEIVKGELELLVKRISDSQLALELSYPLSGKPNLVIVKETPTRLRVIAVKPDHWRIADILGLQNRLLVPTQAEAQVLGAINAISGLVTVHSDIGGGDTNLREVPADAKIHVHMMPVQEGLKLAMLVRPFAEGDTYYRPGSGGEMVTAEVAGERLRARRDLASEREQAAAVLAACKTLTEQEEVDGEWLIPDPQDCLELLLELQALGDQITIAWPEGEKMRIKHQMDFKNLSLSIRQQQDWFGASGELQLDGQQVLDMQQLMQLLGQTKSRFLPLGDGQFIALTEEFRKRLDELRAYSEKSGKGLRLHPLAALGIEDWVEGVGQLEVDQHWQANIRRLQEVQALDPQLPSTLQAELRDYQLEGYRWLARLAHWGVGACLADDMGLGKTLQALALVLSRAPEGPTLVIAPTSVCANWLIEAQRFAPTLKLLQIAQMNLTERQNVIADIEPFDLLVCSYGLLQQPDVAELLADVEWQTIVLDEAQSIKNFATKRSQGAMNLQGKFKLITTGTPVENSLSELWNLFRFINPGLLSSLDTFNQRFAYPIERYQDRAARNQLKKLVQPFILRRTKSQVLSELPSRTEIVLEVEMSKQEMAFYEALRRQAVDRLADDTEDSPGAKHLKVLAEIMRLRRACCHSQLVQPELNLPSAKLQLFGEVLDELLANNHKALVFSQFVDHLHIIQAYLDERKISYQYLDGSTPASQRQKRVSAFQAGEGDVFLISLKAGGTGLNLTAADYVIHMDPWWNPAVEDQASDRAHRIGQQRPVTIYRLVTKNTIEEKIVQLHSLKRDLADSLLEGTDSSGKLSTNELLKLMQQV